tara:strand:+ start:6812 stop:7411 length:600 start_codon:yes stop_codon:yes gene_type:complete
MKDLLKVIWKMEIQNIPVESTTLLNIFEERIIKKAIKEKLIKSSGNALRLTKQGREKIKIVACGGVFDILHPGHGFFLRKAKKYGDILVVIVALDSTVKKRKRIPIITQEQRRELVSHLKPVDYSVLGKEGDILKIIEILNPSVIVLGPNQRHDKEKMKDELMKRGLKVKIKRVKKYYECPLPSTKLIIDKILERYHPK